MKKLLCLVIALGLVFAILFVAVADVNHGYGPGYHYEGGHGDDHGGGHGDDHAGEHGDDHETVYDDHGVDEHGAAEAH